MNADQFDTFARSFATARQHAGTRRALLRALGLGAGAVMLGDRDAAGNSARNRRAEIRARNQEAAVDPLIDEIAFELEYDIARIFAYVRDEVMYDPYAGVLRGARGTAWGLAGNAADQAVLLAALLNASLITTRFVIGELAEEAAERLLAAAIQDEDATLRHAAQVLIPPAPAEAPPALTAEEEAFASGLPDFAERYREAVDRHVTDGVTTVTEALASVGIELPSPLTVLPELERGQHVWLQYSEGTQWIDLDPSLPGSQPGAVHANGPVTHEELPPELFHQVTVRLIAEQVVGGAPARQELVSHSAPSAELTGVPLTIFHPQAEAMRAAGQAITGEIAGYRNFMTTLIVGEEAVNGRPVTFSTGGGALDVFGGSDAVEGETIAEWIEFDIQTPIGSRRITRELFDRIGFAERASGPIDLAAVRPLELVEAGDPELSYLPLAGAWSISVVNGTLPARRFLGPPTDVPTIADIAQISQTFHFARDVFALRVDREASVRTFIDEPNVSAFVLRPTSVSPEGESVASGIDLLHRSVAVVGRAENADVHPQVRAGVLGHAVEQAMVEAGLDPLIDLPVRSSTGVGRLFEEAKRANIATLVLKPGDDRAWLSSLPDAARIRIESALDAGLVVIVPDRPVMLGDAERSGWWLVDPATGATYDQMDDGGGLQLAGYILPVIKGVSCGIVLIALGFCAVYVAILTARTLTPSLEEGSADEDVAAAAAAANAAAASAAGSGAAGSGVVGGAAAISCAA